MEFGSKFVYLSKGDEQDLFDEEQLLDEAPAPPPQSTGFFGSFLARSAAPSSPNEPDDEDEEAQLSDAEVDESEIQIKTKKIRRVRKQDTNIVAINLGTLADPAISIATGDATFCKQCQVALSMHSAIQGNTWVCEYCDAVNQVFLDEPEIPRAESIDYLIAPAATTQSSESNLVVFAIDISNSMCVTQEVSGDLKIKLNAKLNEEMNQFIESTAYGQRADQYLPNERRDISYVSRLQCVQAAVAQQIDNLAKEHPMKRVAIVTFANDVTVYLPGSPQHVISGDKLEKYDHLLAVAGQLSSSLKLNVRDSRNELIKIVHGLTESGATALGPALLVSVGLAGSVPGSSVFLCTDGVANVGLGSLEDYRPENAATHPAPSFFQNVANDALQRGVSVSIVTIKGTNTNLEHIAKVAAATKGMTDIVDPLKLDKNFNFILQNAVVATEVTAKMFVHKALFIRHESQHSPVVEIPIGNVARESAITFEYGVKDISLASGLAHLPFQIQITYTRLDGAKCMRVLSRIEEVTNKREEAEQNMNVNVIGMFAQQTAANLASEGNYTKARMKQKSAMRMIKRNMASISKDQTKSEQLQAWESSAAKLNRVLKEKKVSEKKKGFDYDSASDDESGNEAEDVMNVVEKSEPTSSALVLAPRSKQARKQFRSLARTEDDSTANIIYQNANPTYSAFSKKK